MEKETIVCCKCGCEMKQKEMVFQYMGYHFNHSLPTCPSCGQVYITEDAVNGKIKEIEMLLEEK